MLLIAARTVLIDGRHEFADQGMSGAVPRPRRPTGCEAHGHRPVVETAHTASLSLMKPKPCVPTVFSAYTNTGDGGCFG
ncbi:hypothetical protein [Saccharothrix xinjiangensis]|uniref:Uncharacterized protein n=1 Tax=Saccharothrix xinjiangensis TaxID=204798 RepID=A0ABV9YCE1_9PSEU